jgi:hypothetical protein
LVATTIKLINKAKAVFFLEKTSKVGKPPERQDYGSHRRSNRKLLSKFPACSCFSKKNHSYCGGCFLVRSKAGAGRVGVREGLRKLPFC